MMTKRICRTVFVAFLDRGTKEYKVDKVVRVIACLALAGCGLRGLVAAASPSVPEPFICIYGHSDDPGVTDQFRRIIPPFTVIEGTSTDADFIQELRERGRVYAAHVLNPASATTAELVGSWRAPFDNDLGGQLPGGYDAIAIDELHGEDTNGTGHSDAVVAAFQQLRLDYPNKGIYAAATWHYGQNSSAYSDQLNAINTHADMLMLETYIREGNPSYGWLVSYADNLKTIVPRLLSKTIPGLYISQGGFVADDTTSLGFWGHLDEQFHRIRNDPDASTMPGVMFWVYYRSQRELAPDHVARLVDHYYIQNKRGYFGDGGTEQLVTNAQFEPDTAGWTLTPGPGGTIERFDYGAVGFDSDHDDHALASHGSFGLKTIRGGAPNEASFQVDGVDPNAFYTVSAWVMADSPGQQAKLVVTDAAGAHVESMEIDNVGSPPDWYTKWNEWSRIIFNFVPTSETVHVVLSDEPASPGTTLYWDFVELERAYALLDDNLKCVDLSDLEGDLPLDVAYSKQILWRTEDWEHSSYQNPNWPSGGESILGYPTVVKNNHGLNQDNKYFLYYAHHDPMSGIGCAVADSIEGPYTKIAELDSARTDSMVLTVPNYNPAGPNPGDPSHYSSPAVVWNEDEGLWFMYFHYFNHYHGAWTADPDSPGEGWQMTALATCPDLSSHNWTIWTDPAWGFVSVWDIVPVHPTTDEAWSIGASSYNRVQRLPDGTWLAFLRGTKSTGQTELGFATSTDGRTWDHLPQNPVIISGAPWTLPADVFRPKFLGYLGKNGQGEDEYLVAWAETDATASIIYSTTTDFISFKRDSRGYANWGAHDDGIASTWREGDRLYLFAGKYLHVMLLAPPECPNAGDTDGDGVCGDVDNCPDEPNADQADADGDGVGNVCDDCTDTDGDGFGDLGFSANACPPDNCPNEANPNQADADSDGLGDVCDNCPNDANADQADGDGDGLGDICDICPFKANGNPDLDGDGDVDAVDFLGFSACFNGSLNPPVPGCGKHCESDMDADNDVDVNDFLTFSNCFNGALNPPACP